MSHAAVLVTRNDYTEDAYPTCGYWECTNAIMRALGAPEGADNDKAYTVAERVTVESSPREETGSCVHCAACGDFVEHGNECEHATDEWGYPIDVDPLDGPHSDLKGHPVMARFI